MPATKHWRDRLFVVIYVVLYLIGIGVSILGASDSYSWFPTFLLGLAVSIVIIEGLRAAFLYITVGKVGMPAWANFIRTKVKPLFNWLWKESTKPMPVKVEKNLTEDEKKKKRAKIISFIIICIVGSIYGIFSALEDLSDVATGLGQIIGSIIGVLLLFFLFRWRKTGDIKKDIRRIRFGLVVSCGLTILALGSSISTIMERNPTNTDLIDQDMKSLVTFVDFEKGTIDLTNYYPNSTEMKLYKSCLHPALLNMSENGLKAETLLNKVNSLIEESDTIKFDTEQEKLNVERLYSELETSFTELIAVDEVSVNNLNKMTSDCNKVFSSYDSLVSNEFATTLPKKFQNLLPILAARKDWAEAYIEYAILIQNLYAGVREGTYTQEQIDDAIAQETPLLEKVSTLTDIYNNKFLEFDASRKQSIQNLKEFSNE